jgi:FtsP/CotA-like multicopper oxidase with cupredoxin domain
LPDDSLKDIPAPPPPQPHRTLKFGWEKGREVQGRDNKTNAAPVFTIDDQKFKDKTYQQTMYLGQVEDWKITNTTSLTHSFHIHVNPFQVIEIYDSKPENGI